MFRIAAHSFGAPDQVLSLETADRPLVERGQVLVRMRASPINPSDLIPVTGAYRHRTARPFIPGFEGVGVVADVGEGIDPVLIGRRVLPLGTAGCWQSWKTLPADWCVTVPEDLDDDEAATAYINPLTALLMVRRLAPKPGDRIGVTAAGSAIGRMLIRMLAARGARPVGIIRSFAARQSISTECAEVVEEGCPLPALDSGLDAVGGAPGTLLGAAIKPGGLLLHYGLLSGQPLSHAGQASMTLFRLRDHVHAMPREAFHNAMSECFSEIRTGRASSLIEASYPLEAFRAAFAHNRSSGRRGKIMLRMQPYT